MKTELDNDVETQELEDLIQEEVACESSHHLRHDTCSGQVTHLFKAHDVTKTICLNAATRDRSRVVCSRCLQLAVKCWTIRPI